MKGFAPRVLTNGTSDVWDNTVLSFGGLRDVSGSHTSPQIATTERVFGHRQVSTRETECPSWELLVEIPPHPLISVCPGWTGFSAGENARANTRTVSGKLFRVGTLIGLWPMELS